MLPFIIAGLTTGSVYGLAAVGLVLTYKTSGIFNFAHGALATISAYLFYVLHVEHGMNWELAAVICVLVVGPLLGILFELMARKLVNAPLATRVVSTVGILLIVEGGINLIYDPAVTRSVPEFFPSHDFHIGGTTVSLAQLVIFGVGALAAIGLYLFFRIARLGVAMRGVVDNADLLDISGTNPVAVRRWSWIIGVTFACASGVLLVAVPPPQTLDPLNIAFLVVAAFGAAAIGSFSSLPRTYVGGLVIGVASALFTNWFTSGLLAGLAASTPFLVLFLVLLVSPRRRLVDRAKIVPRNTSSWTTPISLQLGAGAVLLVFLILVPQFGFVGLHIQDWSRGLALTILLLSLGLLTRTSGQVSLAHVSFMAIGVCAFAHLNADAHWPWIVALLMAGLITTPIGALLAIPAIRFSGLYLALATFGFGILLQYMFYGQSYMFGDLGLGVTVNRPDSTVIDFTSDENYYYLVLVICLLFTGLLVAISRSRLGRLLRGLADSPTGLATSGASINVTRVLVFCLSAFIAGIAGVLDAGALAAGGSATINGQSYPPLQSLIYFTLIIISVGGVPWYALVTGMLTMLIPSYLPSTQTSYWLTVLFGVFALVHAMAPSGGGVDPRLRRVLDRIGRRRQPKTAAVTETRDYAPAPVTPGSGLKVNGVRVVFGGLVAVDGVGIDAPVGRITGLIGPNGAGKTTTFNACSGLNRPSDGTITLDDRDISRWGPPVRARHGIGRTFQQMELFDSLTVRENVALGVEGAKAGANPFSHLLSAPGEKARMRAATEHALAMCDSLEIADRVVGDLSTGQRRLVELARCLAGTYRVILLDEPSSGLDRAETARFGEVLQRVVAERNVGILLVEHDMALVTDICEYIYVLDFGKLIFEGEAADVIASPVVQAAYLGSDDVPALRAQEETVVEG
ncbi:branched-chain amino acid ABC transporter permease/ATP-binding protein [Amycolatopsis sp. GM8]|uniref:branched-chain amino acid ABC transporter permease/ATP-binding protein n=1 Tax=Amycolatopsis sp. GM8 TaxID=2896530 RepID=UPI001EFFDAC8|nr:branched-chain amino acid ABC transporter permease/ATP-binding protein [Amycolatopsis sp. GM8]